MFLITKSLENTFGLILKNKMAAMGVSLSVMKSAYNSELLVLEVWDGKPTYRKSRAGNLLGSSFKFKVCITRLLLVLELCNVKPTYRKSWAGNLLVWSDLTLDPSFKVYRKSWAGNLLMWSNLTLGSSFMVKRG